MKSSKCKLCQRSVKFLGHIVSEKGVECDPEKFSAITNWEPPWNVTDVRSFLGLASYCLRYVEGFALIAEPLTRLTRRNVDFVCSKTCQEAFDALKERISNPPILCFPVETAS